MRASAISSWNYTQDMLKTNLSLKNSTPTSIKYFLTKYFIESLLILFVDLIIIYREFMKLCTKLLYLT